MKKDFTNRLYNQSCAHMDAVPDESVSFVLTSPPYWVDPADTYLGPALLRDTQGGTPQSYEGLLALLERCFAECLRVMRPGGVLAVNVASTRVKGRLYPLPFELALLLERQGWLMKEEIIWRRWRGWDRRAGHLIRHPFPGYFFPNRVFEYVLVFNKPGPPLYAGRTAEEKEEGRIVIDDLYVHETANNIWNILPVQPGSSRHPCPFPEELAYRLVSLYSYKGDVVLDPFAGSGTTLKVARLLGRQWVGYEQNPQFARLAGTRVQETVLARQRRITRFVLLDK